ncbi:MAG: hypothetical protein FWE17_02700 [Alphaproteobacteria bacterium]|nr:hypothetical protein [Alphaproteobacteria bacterium]MCL2757928.1 hypothetical protein [Alphaproteobacteria bacterium]
MLSGITFYTEDKIWAQILTDLGAASASRTVADLIFNPVDFSEPMSGLELKSKIVAQIDEARKRAVRRACKADANVSMANAKIITLLERAGAAGVSAADLRISCGYAPDANSHAIDTAIYALRKQFGTDFIKTENGRYRFEI